MVKIGKNEVGSTKDVYLIAEIGINHNGDINLALDMIKEAHGAGAHAVKFQKRTPEICVPKDEWSKLRVTPWGEMTYIDYKRRIEFGRKEYHEINELCKSLGIDWFASPWDIPSVEFLEEFDVCCYKLASASITDMDLLEAVRKTGKPVIMSTGMSTMDEIKAAVEKLGQERLLIAHSTSSYPCSYDELNLKMIEKLSELYPSVPIGYSGHEKGVMTSVAAVAFGATHIERHFTIDRTMWGTDQSASLEPKGFSLLARDVKILQRAIGDGVKRVYDSEIPIRKKLRG